MLHSHLIPRLSQCLKTFSFDLLRLWWEERFPQPACCSCWCAQLPLLGRRTNSGFYGSERQERQSLFSGVGVLQSLLLHAVHGASPSLWDGDVSTHIFEASSQFGFFYNALSIWEEVVMHLGDVIVSVAFYGTLWNKRLD